MHNKKRNKPITALFTALMLAVSLLAGVLSTPAFAVTQDEIDAIKSQRDALTEKRQAQQNVVDQLEAQEADILEQKAALDERNSFTIEQMQLNSQEISLYGDMIAEKALEVEDAKELEAQQLERYRSRVRAMEENGNYNILALVLKSNDLGELLTIMDDIGEIMTSDRELEDQYIAARQNTENVKADYEATKTELEAKQAELEEEQKQLEAELEEASQLLAVLTENLKANAATLSELQAAEDAADAQVTELVAALEEERKAQAGNSGGGSGGSAGAVGSTNFIWPVSCTYITSCVGYRFHPVSNLWKYHSGMDIGCAYGDTVSASDTGTVSLAGWNGGYGNCVMINHNNGYYTLYGHLSSIAVSVGDNVSQGQTVGYVGSTGVSTGPHLHFEIREGTICLDFASWFSGLTYAADSGG